MRNALAILFLLLSCGSYAQGPEPFRVIFDLNHGQWIKPLDEFFRGDLDVEQGQD